MKTLNHCAIADTSKKVLRLAFCPTCCCILEKKTLEEVRHASLHPVLGTGQVNCHNSRFTSARRLPSSVLQCKEDAHRPSCSFKCVGKFVGIPTLETRKTVAPADCRSCHDTHTRGSAPLHPGSEEEKSDCTEHRWDRIHGSENKAKLHVSGKPRQIDGAACLDRCAIYGNRNRSLLTNPCSVSGCGKTCNEQVPQSSCR